MSNIALICPHFPAYVAAARSGYIGRSFSHVEVGDGVGHGGCSYAVTPTEVFARSWEMWAAANGRGGSFVRPMDGHRADPLHSPSTEDLDALDAYFDSLLPEEEWPAPVEDWTRAPECEDGIEPEAWEEVGGWATIEGDR